MRRFAAKLAAQRGDRIEWAPGEVRGVIHGPLPNKSNSRKIVRVRGRMLVIKDPAAIEWQKAFDVAYQAVCLNRPVWVHDCETRFKLHAAVYQQDLRRDLDIELIPDALQKSGMILNDRAIWEKHAIRKIDRDNPRVEFALRPIMAETPLFQKEGA